MSDNQLATFLLTHHRWDLIGRFNHEPKETIVACLNDEARAVQIIRANACSYLGEIAGLIDSEGLLSGSHRYRAVDVRELAAKHGVSLTPPPRRVPVPKAPKAPRASKPSTFNEQKHKLSYVEKVCPIVLADILAQRKSGMSLRSIADRLNGAGVLTPHGGTWTHDKIFKICRMMRNGA